MEYSNAYELDECGTFLAREVVKWHVVTSLQAGWGIPATREKILHLVEALRV